MLFRVQSAAVYGITAYPISVEVDLSSGQKLNLMTVGFVGPMVTLTLPLVMVVSLIWRPSCFDRRSGP